MNIAEMRAPQDGRISLTISGRPVDFRVSSQPTLHGENIVLRILDRARGIVPLDGLGLAESQLDQLKLMIARPEGIILATGPTGSGKTTTLY
ncbi:ATPase, T2SS/T4P/T4SS family, partial [Acinetobacter baumannii]